MIKKAIWTAVLIGAGVLAASSAWAQAGSQNTTTGDDASNFARNRNVSVARAGEAWL